MAQLIGKNFKHAMFYPGTSKREFIKERTLDTSDKEFPEDGFMVVDIGDVIQKHQRWVDELPRVTPFYAVKCMPYTPLLKVMAALGAGFDCASLVEIDRVLSIGVSPSRIVYSHTRKRRSYLLYAARNNVDLMTFDDVAELSKIKELFPTSRLLLRVRFFDKTAQLPFSLKFGCHQTRVIQLMEYAKTQNMNVVGVHFHIGSGSENPSMFENALQVSRTVFNLGKCLGFKMTIMNIGGGLPGITSSKHPFTQFAQSIRKGIEEYFPADSGVTIMAEPGRYYVGSAGTLVTNIIGVSAGRQNDELDSKASVQVNMDNIYRPLLDGRISSVQELFGKQESAGPDTKMNYDYMYFVNDGEFTSFLRKIHDWPVAAPENLKEVDGPLTVCTIVGETLAEKDVILEECMLPKLDVGDWLVFEDMGAYTYMSTDFNGFKKPYVYYAVPDNVWSVLYPLFNTCTENADARLTQTNGEDEIDLPILSKDHLRHIYTLGTL